MNTYQVVVVQTTGWVLVLLDGWVMHTYWVAALGFVFLIYSMWKICMDTTNNDDSGHKYIKHSIMDMPPTRNEVLEEVAKEFDKMRSLGDTAASFAAYVRGMKQ